MDKLTAKDLASQLRAKADELESLTEEELKGLKSADSSLNGCMFTTPCILVDCFRNSPA